MENEARRVRVTRKYRLNGVEDPTKDKTYTLVKSENDKITTYAVFDTREHLAGVSEEEYMDALNQLITALNGTAEERAILVGTAIYSEAGCAYICKINGVVAKDVTSSSITVEAQELDPTLPALAYEFSIDGGFTWQANDPDKRNVKRYSGLQPDTQYTIMARETFHGQCSFSSTIRTAPPVYSLFSLDLPASLKIEEVEKITVGTTSYNAPFTTESILNIQLIVGTAVNILIAPTVDNGTGDTGWSTTVTAAITNDGGETPVTTQATQGFSSMGLTFTPQAGGRQYKLSIY